MITRIEVHNYQCFPELAVDLDRDHVLADANGAGKTTLLDIPVLLGEMLRNQSVVAAFLERPTPGATALTGPFRKEQGDAIAFGTPPPSVLEVLEDNVLRDLNRPEPRYLRYELRLEITARDMQAAAMSVTQRQDATFNEQRDHLRAWFPEQP